jgi:hypothetical protein
MRQHGFDYGKTCNRLVLWDQDERAHLFKNLRKKSLDELRHLIIEFRQASERVHPLLIGRMEMAGSSPPSPYAARINRSSGGGINVVTGARDCD